MDTTTQTKRQSDRQFFFLNADDDDDDRFFFEKTLKEIQPENRLSFVEDGEKLMTFLSQNPNDLPDILFLDLNMPRKNGAECLIEIKENSRYKNIPIIIYTTASQEDNADSLYENGAHYFVRKENVAGLTRVFEFILGLLASEQLERPERPEFVLKIS